MDTNQFLKSYSQTAQPQHHPSPSTANTTATSSGQPHNYFPKLTYNEKMAFYNQNQFFNYYRAATPFPPNFYQGPQAYSHNFNPAFFNNYTPALPHQSIQRPPLHPNLNQQNQVVARRKNINVTKSQLKIESKPVKVKREAVVEKQEVPSQPVPFVFTEKERNDCINSLKQEHNLYELFEDIPNTGPKHCYSRPSLTDTTSGNVPENHFSFKILEELQQLSKFLQTSSIIEKRLHELRNLIVTDHDQSGKLNWEEIDKQAYAICDSALTDLDNSWAKRQSSEQSQSQPQYNPNKITQSGGYGTNCWAVFNYYKIIPKHLTGPGKRVKLTDTSIMKDRLQVLWASKSLLKLLGDPYKNPFHTRGRSLENHLRDNGLRRLSEYCKKFDTDYPDPSATSIELLKEVGFQNVCQTSTATICKMSKKFKHTDMKIRQGKSGGCCDDNTSQYNLFFMCINPNNPDPFHKLFDREPNRSISRTESIVSYTSFCNANGLKKDKTL